MSANAERSRPSGTVSGAAALTARGAPPPQSRRSEVTAAVSRLDVLETRAEVERQAGRYDPAERKRGQRRKRERGVWVYIAAQELDAAGFGGEQPPPFYRCHGHRRSRNAGSVIVSLYREP